MGNIVTPDQGLLPLPAAGAVTSPYPWWLNLALAIWGLLALLCCWLLLLLYLLRYCCRWCRHRQYAAGGKSLRERFFGGGGGASGRQNAYVARNHFASAPLPPVPPYAVSGGNEIYETRLGEGTYGAANRAFSGDSESFSDEEMNRDNNMHSMTENVETNIHRNITKNYYINEEKNYYVQKDPLMQHEQEVQRLPPPTITTVNMAAERIAENPNWEHADRKENTENQQIKQASPSIEPVDSSISNQNVQATNPPPIFTHRPITPVIKSRKLAPEPSIISDSGSTTSEMSGHDSESIYETIRVFTPKKPRIQEVEDDDDDDENKTAGVDEVEIEIQDLVRLQRANPKSTTTYDDIVTSTAMPQQHLKAHDSSSISSSSTLNALMPSQSREPTAEEKEETVTETVKTQQIQTTFHQIGHIFGGNSAFFVPLTSSNAHQIEQQQQQQQQHDEEGDGKIRIPVSTSIEYESQPALQHF